MRLLDSPRRRPFAARALFGLWLVALAAPAQAAAPVASPVDPAQLSALFQLANEAKKSSDEDDRQLLWAQFLGQSAAIARSHPEQVELWALRATAALELNRSQPAREAAQHLIPVPAPSDSVRLVLTRLVARGWTTVIKQHTALPAGPAAPASLAGRSFKAAKTGIKLHWCPPGTFHMGTDASNFTGRAVHITRGFWIGETEVTQAQWTDFVGQNPSNFQQAARLPEQRGQTIIGDDRPVEQVSWFAAMEFCNRLTAAERDSGNLPPGFVYRLPTEAEWEYAARAGVTGYYPVSLERIAWYDADSHDSTHDVGGKKANAWGLRDMAGNVAEWCFDWYRELDADDSTDWVVLDPDPDSRAPTRVIHGGSWLTVAPRCQPGYRSSDDPNNTVSYVGFRIALAPAVTAQ
ncbi:MAG TPA: formylglycine-generating enzyme family protein [Opitutus sp.]|nr:formylglycine-generating enzyme family protein [Opitutus sp.]